MSTKADVVAAAQAALDAANALEVSVAPTITDVKVEESDGSVETLVPEAELPPTV